MDLGPERGFLRELDGPPGSDREGVAGREDRLGPGVHDHPRAAQPLDEDAVGREGRLEIRHAAARGGLRREVGPRVPVAVGRLDARLVLRPAGERLVELLRLLLQVHPQELRREAREEPHDEAGPDEIADRVRDGDLVEETLFLCVRQGKAVDRLARRSDHGGLRERPGHQARRRPALVLEDLRGGNGRHEARDAQDDGERDLREGVLLEPPEELRPDLVARREEEEVEEDELDDRVHLDADLADDDAREERPDDVSELERPEPDVPDEEAQGERQEDGELGVFPEGIGDVLHAGVSISASRTEAMAFPREGGQGY